MFSNKIRISHVQSSFIYKQPNIILWVESWANLQLHPMLLHEHYAKLHNLGINKCIALEEFAQRLPMSQWQCLV